MIFPANHQLVPGWEKVYYLFRGRELVLRQALLTNSIYLKATQIFPICFLGKKVDQKTFKQVSGINIDLIDFRMDQNRTRRIQ